jgi:hypothetical protein
LSKLALYLAHCFFSFAPWATRDVWSGQDYINSAKLKAEHENWINSLRAVAETLAALTRPLCGNTAADRPDEWKMIDRRHRTTRV